MTAGGPGFHADRWQPATTAHSSSRSWRASPSPARVPDARAPVPTRRSPTRATRPGRSAHTCGAAASKPPSPNGSTNSPGGHDAVNDAVASTSRPTDAATSSNVASTASSNRAASPPATKGPLHPSKPPSPWHQHSFGFAHFADTPQRARDVSPLTVHELLEMACRPVAVPPMPVLWPVKSTLAACCYRQTGSIRSGSNFRFPRPAGWTITAVRLCSTISRCRSIGRSKNSPSVRSAVFPLASACFCSL